HVITNQIIIPKETQQEINQLKLKGNDYFRQGNYKESLQCYSLALALLPSKNLSDNQQSNQDTIQNGRRVLSPIDIERVLLHANRAAAFLKMESFKEAAAEATLSLQIEPRHVKSLYRRGQANEYLKNYNEARRDYAAALALSPTSTELMDALIRVKQLCKNQ